MASRTSAMALGSDLPASRTSRPSRIGRRACIASAAASSMAARRSTGTCAQSDDAARATAARA
jgi:hypothetical protein